MHACCWKTKIMHLIHMECSLGTLKTRAPFLGIFGATTEVSDDIPSHTLKPCCNTAPCHHISFLQLFRTTMNTPFPKTINRSSSFDPPCSKWASIVSAYPIEDIDNMSETRNVAVDWETVGGEIQKLRGSVTLERYGQGPNFRLSVTGCQVRDGDVVTMKEDGTPVDLLEDQMTSIHLFLTSRFKWLVETDRSKDSEGNVWQFISIKFLRDASRGVSAAASVSSISILVPESNTSNNGHLLALSIHWASCVAEANMAYETLKFAVAMNERNNRPELIECGLLTP